MLKEPEKEKTYKKKRKLDNLQEKFVCSHGPME
jgi:hypothetical protein